MVGFEPLMLRTKYGCSVLHLSGISSALLELAEWRL